MRPSTLPAPEDRSSAAHPARPPRLRFRPVFRLADGAPSGLVAENDIEYCDRRFPAACRADEEVTAAAWLGALIERSAARVQMSGSSFRPLSISAPAAALTDIDAPLAAEAGARRTGLLPQEIRIDFDDAAVAALEDAAADRLEAMHRKGFRIGLDCRRGWRTPIGARLAMLVEAVTVSPARLEAQGVPLARVKSAAAAGVMVIADAARWRDGPDLAAIGVVYAVQPTADA
jgi:hypothetical protein